MNKNGQMWIVYCFFILIIGLLVFGYFWGRYDTKKLEAKYGDCYRPIAENFCNNLSTSTGLHYISYQTHEFQCCEERGTWDNCDSYKFLQKEINKCENTK
jgi:hypothetical protein